MIRFLLDTDHLSLQQRGQPHLAKRLAEHPSEEVATSVITMEEMIRGRLAILSRRSEGEKRILAYRRFQDTVRLFCTVPTVAFDPRSEQRFQELKALRLKVGTQDLRIAAIALANGLVILTRNVKDFGQVPGLMIEDWTTVTE